MKVTRILRNTILSALFILLAVPTGAWAVSIVRLGAQANFLNPSYPGFIGVGPAIQFFRVLQIDASFAPFEYVVSKVFSQRDFIWGTSARVTLPTTWSPSIGVAYSQRHLHGVESKIYGHRDALDKFISPFAGVAYAMGDGLLKIELGLMYTLKENKGIWSKYDPSNSGTLSGTGLNPYGQVVITPF